MTETRSLRSLKFPARDVETFNIYLHLPFEPVALQMMQIPVSADDVFIATFPKSGTTWMQQICHGLRSGGDMNFKEVSWVPPWLERGHMFGIDSRLAQAYAPRVFKTHLPYAQVNRRARYIHVIRDPKDAPVSFYGFLSHRLIDPTALSIETFAQCWLLADQLAEQNDPDAPFGPYLYNYWRHLLDWWAARAQAPVLTLAYEHLRHDLAPQVARIADFMGISADAALLELATHQAGFDFMAAHQEQFSDEIVGIPGRLLNVVSGKVGAHKQLLSPQVTTRIDAAWQRYVTPVVGATSYEAFIAALP